MPLHGKIVVIKRSGGDGTEFPLTATCLFGRKPDCDIRIQLPQVSKEHCRIDLNENKEIILTNLSSANPTCINGEVLQQSERLKHGDVITIIDRSFRFEYPPARTPKRKSAIGGKTETLKVIQDQQVGDTVTSETGDKRISEVSTDPHLKDGTNHDNIQRSLDKTIEVESKEDDGLLQSKTASPFSDLYQMIKKSLDVKTPRKSSASVLQTPSSRFCTPGSVRKSAISTEGKSTPKKDEAKVSLGGDETGTPKSIKKQRRSSQVRATETAKPEVEEAEATTPQKRVRTPPQRFTASEVIEQIQAQTPKSPVRRRSKEHAEPSPKTDLRKASPRNSGKVEKEQATSKKRKSAELAADLPKPEPKKKRVSFGGYLCPELFDKRLPPDSPLKKGATPRRSLCVSKPKQSLLRRASAIGLVQEFDQENEQSPAKMRTPSPKKTSAKNASPKTPTPGKKSPKSRSPSPKAASPAKKSPKPRTPSPKAADKSPKAKTPSVKAVSPATKSPTPARGKSPAVKTPEVQTPNVQGRFSVSRISTPSPNAEDAVTDQVPLVSATPKITPKRKSISQKTPSIAKSAAKVMRRRSGISRASLKVQTSWADKVRFGKVKAQVVAEVVAPAKQAVARKITKKMTVSKPQTPARQLLDHVSTGHADSPVTIVVGRAQNRRVVQPTGAEPKLVTNTALLKRNMKMDEDLTGISEMYKTPANDRKRKSVINENNATKTPLRTSVVEPSVLNTPEEPGEMVVSPLSVSSTVKDRRYNSEAVQRFLNDDEESSFVSDTPVLALDADDSSEQQCTDLKTTSVTTPKQKPELPECLTGVKRIMKTPKQKAEPVEDLRGKLLKTPKQKPEQRECLTGVKRIMKTPKQKAEPIEDLRGKILKTPKQKPEQQECLTGVKKMLETPKCEAEPVEDIKVELLTTPEQKPEQQVESESLEDVQAKLLETPKVPEASDASLNDTEELLETPAHTQESEDLSEVMDAQTPNVKSSPMVCLTGVKRIMKTPKERSAPVEDMVGVKRLMKTPKEKVEAVEENFGIKRLVKTPRPSRNAAVEDFEGLQELMEEPVREPSEVETNEMEDQTTLDADEDVAKELDFAHEETQGDVLSDVIDDVPQGDTEKDEAVVDVHLEEVLSGHDKESSDVMETGSQTVEENLPSEEPKVDKDEKLPEEELKVDTVDEVVPEEPQVDTVDEVVPEEQPKVGTVDEVLPEEEQPKVDTVDEVLSEEQPQVDTDEVVPEEQPEVDTVDEVLSEEQPQVDTVDEVLSEEQPQVDTVDEVVPEEQPKVDAVEEVLSEEQPKVDTVDEVLPEEQPKVDTIDEVLSEEQLQVDTVDEVRPEEQPKVNTVDEVRPEEQPKVDTVDEVRPEEQPKVDTVDEVLPEEQPKVETAPQVKEMDTTVADPDNEKKSVRGRRAKKVEPKAAEDKQEAAEQSEEPVISAPVRGRRGKKTEAAAPAAVRQTKRGRNAKSEESEAVELTVEKNDTVALKPKRGRNAKKASEDQAEAVQEVETETVPEPESKPTPSVDVHHDANDSAAPPEKAVSKPRRGRKARQPEESVPEQQDVPSTASEDVPEADVAKEADATEVSDQLEVVPSGSDENKSSDAVDTAPQAPVTESLPEVETVTETDAAIVQKKPVRGRRAKTVQPKEPEDKQEAEQSEEPVVPAPVRGRRGKKTEAAAPPAVRQTTRGRNAKTQEGVPEIVPEAAVETPVTETATETVSDQTSPVEESAPPAEEAVVKPVRGRKTKQTPVEPPQPEPEKDEPVSDEPVAEEAQPQISTVSQKPRRGRKTKADAVEQNEVAEDVVVAVETKQLPVRAKRGRNAKQEEEKLETTAVEEPVKKVRRTRKAEQEHVEPRKEIQEVENVPKEAEAPVVAEPEVIIEQAAKPRRGGRKAKQDTEIETPVEVPAVQEVENIPEEAEAPVVAEPETIIEQAAKPRRGGRKAKQDTEIETPVEVQEVPAVSATDKLKRGRRGKQVTEEVAVAAVAPEEEPVQEQEAEENNDAEPEAPVNKRGRARGAKTSAKNVVAQAVPAKRARRGAAQPHEETSAEPTDLVSEPEPAKRGRRAAAKPTADDVTVTSEQAEDSSTAVEDVRTTKRSVKWKENLEVFDIPKVTPVKAVRGRKSKLGGKVDTESKNESQDADKTEEKDLSDNVVEAQPVKRARRGAKVADVTADEAATTTEVKSAEAETQPKTRRGRSAKK